DERCERARRPARRECAQCSAVVEPAVRRLSSRGLRLAAWLLCMTTLAAALSMRLMAVRSASARLSDTSAAAFTAVFTRVLISDRAALLRTRRRSFWRFRLIWLLMLATGFSLQ